MPVGSTQPHQFFYAPLNFAESQNPGPELLYFVAIITWVVLHCYHYNHAGELVRALSSHDINIQGIRAH